MVKAKASLHTHRDTNTNDDQFGSGEWTRPWPTVERLLVQNAHLKRNLFPFAPVLFLMKIESVCGRARALVSHAISYGGCVCGERAHRTNVQKVSARQATKTNEKWMCPNVIILSSFCTALLPTSATILHQFQWSVSPNTHTHTHTRWEGCGERENWLF